MPRQRSTFGKFLASGKAIVILRDDQVITHATIGEKAFQVRAHDLGTLTFTLPQIQSIVYKNLPTYPTDVLRTVGGSEIKGEILTDPIHVRADGLGGGVTLAKAKVLSIVF
jgi:hypothetical protein